MCVYMCVCIHTNINIHTYIERGGGGERILLNWLTQLCRLGKYKACRVGWQAGDQAKICSSSSRAVCWQNSFFLTGGSILFQSQYI